MTMFGNAIGLSPGNLGMKLFKPSAAAPLLWWYPEGPAGWPAVVGAYRAIATVGSPWPLAPANYAESLTNWANPGTYTLTEIGGGSVNWAANVGWSGFFALNRCLDTNINPTPINQTWSVLVEYAGATNAGQYLFGLADSIVESGLFGVRDNAAVAQSQHGAFGAIGGNAPAINAAGNYGFAARQPYRNAVAEAALVNILPGTSDITIYIGARNTNGVAGSHFAGSIKALVIYSGTLTVAQVTAVDAAMAAL